MRLLGGRRARRRVSNGRGSDVDFAFERGYVIDAVAGGYVGNDEIAPPPLAQHAAYVFPCHTGHGREIADREIGFALVP